MSTTISLGMLGWKMWKNSRKTWWKTKHWKSDRISYFMNLKIFLKHFLSQSWGFSGILSNMTASVIGPKARAVGIHIKLGTHVGDEHYQIPKCTIFTSWWCNIASGKCFKWTIIFTGTLFKSWSTRLGCDSHRKSSKPAFELVLHLWIQEKKPGGKNNSGKKPGGKNTWSIL